jgi:hypothetical protein
MKRTKHSELNWYKINKDLNKTDRFTTRQERVILKVLSVSAVLAAIKFINTLIGA